MGTDAVIALLAASNLVQLGPHETHREVQQGEGAGIVAVFSGLVQVRIGGQTPTVHAGEVLVAGAERVGGWHNNAKAG